MHVQDVVEPSHPALAGHFPGNPIVPGVLLLARIASAARQSFGARIRTVSSVRFRSPLRPGQRFDVSLVPAGGGSLRFNVSRDEVQIASGVVELDVELTGGGA